MLRDMNALRTAVNDGLSARIGEVELRQPLASVKLVNTLFLRIRQREICAALD